MTLSQIVTYLFVIGVSDTSRVQKCKVKIVTKDIVKSEV